MTRWQVPVVLAAVAVGTAFGLAFDLGPPLGLTVLALAGIVLAFAAQHRMARLPIDDES